MCVHLKPLLDIYLFGQKLSPELKRKVDEVKAQREGKNEMRKKLEVSQSISCFAEQDQAYNQDAGESDQIVWADQFSSAKPSSGNRKV